MSTVINSTKDLDTLVAETPNVLVDFWATWCGPCKMMNPILESISEEMSGKLTVAKVDVDQQQELAARYGINSIPTMIRFKDGKPVDAIIGAQPKGKLTEYLEQVTALKTTR